MRKIKFRAFDTTEKRMLTNRELTFVHSNGYESILCNILDGDDDNHELMQFTGLTDKSGVDIYEGDIVKYKDLFIGFIYFYQGVYCIDTKLADHHLVTYCGQYLSVIGNIHENPEIVK